MPLRLVQVLIRPAARLLLLSGLGVALAACRTTAPVEMKLQAAQVRKLPPAVKAKKPVAPIGKIAPVPTATPLESKEIVRLEPAPEPARPAVLALNNGRVISQAPALWIAEPNRHVSASDRTPSLLEDAAITSTLHSRLKSLLTTRALDVQCRTTSGKVSLRAGKLTREEAQTLIDEALALDQVREVRLVADFQP